MTTLALINGVYHKRFGRYFFTFGFLLGLHSIPASLTMNTVSLYILFNFACLLVMAASLFGYHTSCSYEGEYAMKAE